MADTLTQLISKVQAQLLDNATLFSTATLTTSIRQALFDINRICPSNHAELITAIANQKEYEIGESQTTLSIFDVLLDGDNEYAVSLDYDAYVEDGRWFFRLRTPQAAGETLIVHYSKPFTISGLDSATDSTLTDVLNVAAIHGACYFACLTRAAYTAEANNVNPDVSKRWSEQADIWKRVFFDELARANPTPVGEPDHRTWEDKYHNWNA